MPFKDRVLCERLRKISGKDLEKHPNPDFKIKVMLNPHPVVIGDIFTRIKESDNLNRKLTLILGNPEPETYIPVAQLINYHRVNCRNVHIFAMDEWADENGNIAPVTYQAGFAHSLLKYLVYQIDEDLRMPLENIHYPTKGRYTEEKRRIAKQIAGMIQSGETLFVNSGTTTLFVVEELQKLSALTIVTNSIPMAMEFSDYPNFNIILLGGNIDLTHSFTYGDDALAQLRKYRADKLILSIDGISLEKGLTTYYFQEVAINKMMMERVERNIVAADFSKIGAESFSYVTDISQVDCLVTNASANTGELQKLRDAGIEICLA